MKVASILASSVLVAAAATAASAQSSDPAAPAPAAAPVRTKIIGVDAGIAMPTGDWSDAVGFGIGALARFEMPLGPGLTLTARAGYIHHLSKDQDTGFGGSASSSAAQIPLFGGVRYAFSQHATTALYGAAELGLDMFRSSVDVGGQSMSDSDTNLGMSLGGGYRTGKLDLRAGLLFADIGEVGDSMALMATAGYDLTAL